MQVSEDHLKTMIDDIIDHNISPENADIFVRSIIPEEIRDFEDRTDFANALAEICRLAVSRENAALAATAFSKAYELAPQMEEVNQLGANPFCNNEELTKYFQKWIDWDKKIAEKNKK